MAVTIALLACRAPGEEIEIRRAPPDVRVPAPLPGAHCEIEVDGVGTLEMETDYLPHVITCENGGANLEALAAQAIAARSVAYYSIETSGSVCDGQGCQVYSCGTEPDALAYQAVEETSGQYLHYSETLTYGFYVSGDSDTAPPQCIGDPGVPIEQWVTYNEGRSGTDVEQTDLGSVHQPDDPGYGQNRGCMSQWGGRCLENDLGRDRDAILRFFYGEDINVERAQGPCVSGDDTGGTTTDSGGDGESSTTTGEDSAGGEVTDDGGGTDEDGGTSSGDSEDAGGLPDTYGSGDANDGGCGCSQQHRRVDLVLLFVAALVRRRRSTPLNPASGQ